MLAVTAANYGNGLQIMKNINPNYLEKANQGF
jgi:hypothetical protein